MSQSAVSLSVNGKKYSVTVDAETPLLFVLRDEIGLTGSKYGCGEGQCGACTVLVGGVARRSCLMPVSEAAEKSITTIEGLEKGGELHPVQAAFVEAEAFQCAYCTSGMIMSSVALLEKNSNPSTAEIVAGLQGNVCRCGAHPRIVEAVQMAAKTMRGKGSVAAAGAALERAAEGAWTLKLTANRETDSVSGGAL